MLAELHDLEAAAHVVLDGVSSAVNVIDGAQLIWQMHQANEELCTLLGSAQDAQVFDQMPALLDGTRRLG